MKAEDFQLHKNNDNQPSKAMLSLYPQHEVCKYYIIHTSCLANQKTGGFIMEKNEYITYIEEMLKDMDSSKLDIIYCFAHSLFLKED